MLIYVNITDRQTDKQTHQKYSSEPHKISQKCFNRDEQKGLRLNLSLIFSKARDR
jgi:hypothetical protein